MHEKQRDGRSLLSGSTEDKNMKDSVADSDNLYERERIIFR